MAMVKLKKYAIATIFLALLSIPLLINFFHWNIYLTVQIQQNELTLGCSDGSSYNTWTKRTDQLLLDHSEGTITLALPSKEVLKIGPLKINLEERIGAVELFDFEPENSAMKPNEWELKFPWLLIIAAAAFTCYATTLLRPANKDKVEGQPKIYWISKRKGFHLGTMACPHGGEALINDINHWKTNGVDIVVSALTDQEMQQLNILREEQLCQATNIAFSRFPIADMSLPASQEEWLLFIAPLAKALKDKQTLVAHCYAGIGRSSLIAISIMIVSGISTETALKQVTKARGQKVPDTDEQTEWLYQFEKFYTTSQNT